MWSNQADKTTVISDLTWSVIRAGGGWGSSLTHQSWMAISGWKSSSSSSHSPSAFRSTTCSMENHLRKREQTRVKFATCSLFGINSGTMTSYVPVFTDPIVGGSICSLVIPVITSCMVNIWSPVTPTCIEATHRSQHLLGCHCYHRGGLLCSCSSHWSRLWIKRNIYLIQDFTKLHSFPLFSFAAKHADRCCPSPSGWERGKPPPIGTWDSSGSGGGVSLLRPVWAVRQRNNFKCYHTYWSFCNPTANMTKPKNTSFSQFHWVCLSVKHTLSVLVSSCVAVFGVIKESNCILFLTKRTEW